MRKIAMVLGVLAAMLLVTGVAEAGPRTSYKISGTWSLQDVDGRLTIIPRIEDDVVEVRCKGDDQVRAYDVSDPERVSWEGITTDGSAVQVEPDFHEVGDSLTLTVSCRRS